MLHGNVQAVQQHLLPELGHTLPLHQLGQVHGKILGMGRLLLETAIGGIYQAYPAAAAQAHRTAQRGAGMNGRAKQTLLAFFAQGPGLPGRAVTAQERLTVCLRKDLHVRGHGKQVAQVDAGLLGITAAAVGQDAALPEGSGFNEKIMVRGMGQLLHFRRQGQLKIVRHFQGPLPGREIFQLQYVYLALVHRVHKAGQAHAQLPVLPGIHQATVLRPHLARQAGIKGFPQAAGLQKIKLYALPAG